MRIGLNDGDYAEAQPGMGSLDYIEELLHVRYRLAFEDITKMADADLRRVILSKDEELTRKDVNKALEITKNDVATQSYDTLLEKLFGGVRATKENPEVERTVTITIKDNKNDRIKYASKYEKDRKKRDPSFKLKKEISNLIRINLKKTGGSKNNETILKYLPYSMEELKNHIEHQFEKWMSWDNWGRYDVEAWDDNDQSTWTWNIDHIKPHSTFKYSTMNDEEFKKCWTLENLRPLSSKQNISEGNRR